MSPNAPNKLRKWLRGVGTAASRTRRRRPDQVCVPTCDSAIFLSLWAGSSKVAGQKADKELERLRRVFARHQSRKQAGGGVGYSTVGIIEPRFSSDESLFMEETCENRARTHYR